MTTPSGPPPSPEPAPEVELQAPDGLAVFDAPPPVPGAEPATSAEEPLLAYAEAPPESDRLAHPALRAFAFFLDGVGTVLLVIVIVFGGLSTGGLELFWAILLVPLAVALVATVLTALFGVTGGKALLGLRVVDAETGGRIGLGRSLVRSLVIVSPILLAVGLTWGLTQLPWELTGWYFGSPLPLFIPIVGWVALLVVFAARPRHRGLQDLAGRSLVVRR